MRAMQLVRSSACVMSTHIHLVLTDVRGVYPDFLQYLNRIFANVVKVLRGWGHEPLLAGTLDEVLTLLDGYGKLMG